MPRKPTGKPNGRPPKQACLDWKETVENLCPWYTQQYIAALMGISIDTLDDKIQSEYGITFSELKKQKKTECVKRIFHTQYLMVVEDRSVPMAIWLGKQYGQTDKQEIKQNIEAKVQTIEEYLKDKEAK